MIQKRRKNKNKTLTLSFFLFCVCWYCTLCMKKAYPKIKCRKKNEKKKQTIFVKKYVYTYRKKVYIIFSKMYIYLLYVYVNILCINEFIACQNHIKTQVGQTWARQKNYHAFYTIYMCTYTDRSTDYECLSWKKAI